MREEITQSVYQFSALTEQRSDQCCTNSAEQEPDEARRAWESEILQLDHSGRLVWWRWRNEETSWLVGGDINAFHIHSTAIVLVIVPQTLCYSKATLPRKMMQRSPHDAVSIRVEPLALCSPPVAQQGCGTRRTRFQSSTELELPI